MKYILFFLLISNYSISQKSIDIKSYDLNITVNDSTNEIDVIETITLKYEANCSSFKLDLVSKGINNKGMVVHSITSKKINVDFEHKNTTLKIFTNYGIENQEEQFIIHYSGIPNDGLVIGENKYSERTFFGDNWPNRAQNWIACVDHPSDKALVSFVITAPGHYSIVAVGQKKQYIDLEDGRQKIMYESSHVLPTKVIVFGAADFSSEKLSSVNDFEISSWVYNESREGNLSDLRIAVDPLNFYIDKIGPYPFEKLANVQSTTRFGGMENAGCIFYDEHAFTGKNKMENLIAHEIAHQWFGNTVTESDWQHLWLSEGFATYLTNLHIEHKYGRKAMNKQLLKDKQRIINFEDQIKRPVIDTITTDLMHLLNPNSYQKGSWFLHMLRNKIGDDFFWEGLEKYYNKYKYKNATSDDFMIIMENVSKQNLNAFFDQWLRKSEIPNLKVKTKKKCFKRIMIIEQVQKELYDFPLEIEFTEDGITRKQVVNFSKQDSKVEIVLKKRKKFQYKLDPNSNLLYRESYDISLIKR